MVIFFFFIYSNQLLSKPVSMDHWSLLGHEYNGLQNHGFVLFLILTLYCGTNEDGGNG